MDNPHLPEIIAHRGYSSRAPENTLIALETAVRAGADGIEFDVQTAACGTPVLFHDAMLGRTTNGVGPLRRRPLGQLKELDAGRWFGPGFSGTTIPTLAEALSLVAGRVGTVFQDVKGYREVEDLDRMVAVTRKAGLETATIFTSSDWAIMNRFREVAPEIRRAYLADGAEGLSDALDRAIVDEGSMLSVEIGLARARPEIVQEALRSGVRLVVWTVNDGAGASAAREMGIQRIMTDQVDRLLCWRESQG